MKPFDHTPGPYQLGDRMPSSLTIQSAAPGLKPRYLASVRSAGLTEKEVRANAALFSAAARMHAVLWAIRGSNEAATLLAGIPAPDGGGNLWKLLNIALIEASTGIPVETQESQP